MGGYMDRAEPIGDTVSLFSVIMEQRKRINQLLAVFESLKHNQSFFNVDKLVRKVFT